MHTVVYLIYRQQVRSPSWHQYCKETFSKILTSDLIFPSSWVNWGKGNELSIPELIAWARGHFSCLECQYLLQPALQCWQNIRRKDTSTLWSVSCNPDNALRIVMYQWMIIKFCKSCHCYYDVCHSSSKKETLTNCPADLTHATLENRTVCRTSLLRVINSLKNLSLAEQSIAVLSATQVHWKWNPCWTY